jgi:ribosomal-protein-alanine N-acetyltransferase
MKPRQTNLERRMTTIQTPRLILREFCDDDFAALWDIYQRPELHRYENTLLDEQGVKTLLKRTIEQANALTRTVYRLAVTLHPEDRAVGRISLVLHNSSIDEWEIGWTIHPALWGRGLASEGALGLLGLAFGELQAHRVVAFCHADNQASVRVMEKIGMQREGRLRQTRRLNGMWSDEFAHAILRSDWEARAKK